MQMPMFDAEHGSIADGPNATGPDDGGPVAGGPDADGPDAVDRPLPPLGVEVVRSARRKKTAEARLVGDTVIIRVPARMSQREVADMETHFLDHYERRRRSAALDLTSRASTLARRHGLPTPTDIRWVSNQRQRWGSCTPALGTVRLSDRMTSFPAWVIDYVIVHELAHLVEANHSRRFWALVEQYPLTERARGFLIAKGGED